MGNIREPLFRMNKKEGLAVILTLIAIWSLAYINFTKSQVLARDVQRKNDLKHVASALSDYLDVVGTYPASQDGKIVACGTDFENLAKCNWGQDGIKNPKITAGYFINPLPEDPLSPPKHYAYLYRSNSKDFQLYAHLEDKNDAEYNKDIEKLGLTCGRAICNFGVANGKTSLEDELLNNESSGKNLNKGSVLLK